MSTEERKPENSELRWVYPAVMLVALLVLVIGLYRGCGTALGEAREEGPIPLREVSPEVVARSYLSSLKLRQLDSAYQLLSDERKANLSFEDYEKALAFWLDEGENAWELKYREVGECSVQRDSARLLVTAETGSEATSWEWHFVKTGQGWRLSDLKGGPSFDSRSSKG